jgi:hypothetical protein
MPSTAVIDAVEDHLAANWSACPVIGLKTPGDRPANFQPFVVVQYPVANSEQLTIGAPGANVWRTEGAFRIVLHFDKRQQMLGVGMAEQIATLFRGKHIGAVRTLAPSPPVADDSNDEGGYFRLSFAVPYHHDLIG